MLQVNQKNLVEVCPQCCKLVNSSANRLVHDGCGHLKCRICLLQEITGCLLCVAEKQSSDQKGNTHKLFCSNHTNESQQRKSVITSLAIQIAEQKQNGEPNSLSPPVPSVDNDTCHLIKQSMEKDILFPTDIVKRSFGNFYHLKRVFSQRFFSENGSKKNRACETERKWSLESETGEEKLQSKEESLKKKRWKIPNHIQVQFYCKIHKLVILEKSNVLRHHMTCNKNCTDSQISIHQCKTCNKKYKTMGKLNRHINSHTKSSKFKCGKCGKCCTDNYALRNHERTHTQQKPYSCQYCEKKFSGLQNFKRHEKKHRDEKKFVCNECGFKFITKTELKRHLVIHTNIKSFSCSVCSSKFAFKRTLVRHFRTHDANLERIKCQHCESTFKRKDNLERHIKMAHLELKTE